MPEGRILVGNPLADLPPHLRRPVTLLLSDREKAHPGAIRRLSHVKDLKSLAAVMNAIEPLHDLPLVNLVPEHPQRAVARFRVIQAFTHPELQRTLHENLNSDNAVDSLRAANLLARMGQDAGVDKLGQLAQHENVNLAGSAVRSLGKCGHAKALDILENFYRARNVSVNLLSGQDGVVDSLHALGRFPPKRLRTDIVKIGLKSAESGLRAKLISLLGLSAPSRQSYRLFRGIATSDGESDDERGSALLGIGRCGGRAAANVIGAILADTTLSNKLRNYAAMAAYLNHDEIGFHPGLVRVLLQAGKEDSETRLGSFSYSQFAAHALDRMVEKFPERMRRVSGVVEGLQEISKLKSSTGGFARSALRALNNPS